MPISVKWVVSSIVPSYSLQYPKTLEQARPAYTQPPPACLHVWLRRERWKHEFDLVSAPRCCWMSLGCGGENYKAVHTLGGCFIFKLVIRYLLPLQHHLKQHRRWPAAHSTVASRQSRVSPGSMSVTTAKSSFLILPEIFWGIEIFFFNKFHYAWTSKKTGYSVVYN